MTEIRTKKLEDAIRDKIATMIVTEQIKDHRVGRDINITRVKISSDMSQAKIYVSSYKSEQYTNSATEGLNSASGFVRVALGKTLTCRNTPKPIFYADHSLREGFILGERIKAVASDSSNEEETKKEE